MSWFAFTPLVFFLADQKLTPPILLLPLYFFFLPPPPPPKLISQVGNLQNSEMRSLTCDSQQHFSACTEGGDAQLLQILVSEGEERGQINLGDKQKPLFPVNSPHMMCRLAQYQTYLTTGRSWPSQSVWTQQ